MAAGLVVDYMVHIVHYIVNQVRPRKLAELFLVGAGSTTTIEVVRGVSDPIGVSYTFIPTCVRSSRR